MTQLSVSEARAILPELLDRIADGEEITITRHGKPAAVMLRPDAVRARRGAELIEKSREIGAMIAAAREQPLGPGGLSPGRADELVAALRADRDRD
jgi:antitoxin (DNA-binding transcriptional repressor) of toxin-antitoxin stability system